MGGRADADGWGSAVCVCVCVGLWWCVGDGGGVCGGVAAGGSGGNEKGRQDGWGAAPTRASVSERTRERNSCKPRRRHYATTKAHPAPLPRSHSFNTCYNILFMLPIVGARIPTDIVISEIFQQLGHMYTDKHLNTHVIPASLTR